MIPPSNEVIKPDHIDSRIEKLLELDINKDQRSDCDSLIKLIDTISLNGINMVVQRISERLYDSIASSNASRKFENIYSSEFSESTDNNVFRINDTTIVYRLNDNSYDTLTDYNSRKLGFSKYKSCGFIEPLNSYLFASQYHEAQGSMLINKKSGLKKNLSHHIVISPDNRLLITYAWDGWAFHSGGFDLHEINNGKINPKISYYPSESIYEKKGFYWSFSDIYFLNESNFVFKHQYYIIKDHNMITCYSILRIL